MLVFWSKVRSNFYWSDGNELVNREANVRLLIMPTMLNYSGKANSQQLLANSYYL